jgi:plastocyanin
VHSRSLTRVVLVAASLLLVACGEGSSDQIATNAKADQQTPAAGGASAPVKVADKPSAAPTTTRVGTVGATITIKDDLFEPATVEVAKGAAVTWKWEGKNPHNVSGAGLKSPIQTSGRYT